MSKMEGAGKHRFGQKKMKKLFTVDDIMVAFVSALGYGFGETISRLCGWPEIMCIAASCVLGMALERVISGIAFSKEFQEKKARRKLFYVAVIFFFLVAHLISVLWMKKTMIEYFGEQILYVVGLPVFGFVINLCIRSYHVRKIRKRYGDGNEGFVFEMSKKELAEVNTPNRQIFGEYNQKLAVKTKTGVYVGEKDKKVVYFWGIPYAKPPLGELRWKAPEPLPPSDDVYEAKHLGASPIQVEHKGSILRYHRQSEDCLTLNICVAKERKDPSEKKPEFEKKKPLKKREEQKKPVLVLFHHGDFSSGGSADPLLYGAEYVAKHQDVIFVSFNYRLGVFGFIDFSEIPGGEACPDAVNLGLLDQVAALKWIRENIAAFGGDPEQITVLGFESGATSIILLAAAEDTKGLFKKAFVFNGNPIYAYDEAEPSKALAQALLEKTNTSSMAELMQLSTEDLKAAAQNLWENMSAPTCDGAWIPRDVYKAFKKGAAAGVDFVVGFPANEMQVLRSMMGEERYDEFITGAVTDMLSYVDDTTAQAMRKYLEEQTAATDDIEAKSKLAVQWDVLCIYRCAAMLKEGGNQVHLLYWNEQALIENLGSGTIDVAASLLGNGEAVRMYGSVLNTDLSEALGGLLQKFIGGKDLALYPNEIKGIDGFKWEAFPKALVVADGKLLCEVIEDKLTEVKELLESSLR